MSDDEREAFDRAVAEAYARRPRTLTRYVPEQRFLDAVAERDAAVARADKAEAALRRIAYTTPNHMPWGHWARQADKALNQPPSWWWNSDGQLILIDEARAALGKDAS